MAGFSDNPMAGIIYDDTTINLSTLPAGTAIILPSKIDASREQGFRILRTEWHIAYDGITIGEGPVVFGFSCNVAATEIEACIEADPQDSADRVGNTQSSQPVWPLVYQARSEGENGIEPLNGMLKPRWTVPEGEQANWFAYNRSSSALTTGGVFFVFAKHFGVWLND